MKIIEEILATLPDGPVLDLRVGAFWTAVVVNVGGRPQCGLASALRRGGHHHGGGPEVPEAGRLLAYSARQLAGLARSTSPMEASIGLAAINALLPSSKEHWTDLNAEEIITRRGAGKQVALIGHFPFIPRLKEIVGRLWVLEQHPQGEDLPAAAAAEVIPQADLVAITGTTLINHTFDDVLALCRPDAMIMVLGPSTPLSPVLFEHGVDLLSGALVQNVEPVLQAASQGANFRQVHRFGVRLVTMQRRDLAGQ
ncbi:MAG: DUF364 domain-containing protein [Chloroflexota bacterium]